jgi:hypothetical protein
MDVEDAIIAADFVACDKILDTITIPSGYIKIDHKQAIQQFF